MIVNLTANHGGFFVFQLCAVNQPDKEASEDCLNENNLEIVRARQMSSNSIEEDSVQDSSSAASSDESYESLETHNRIEASSESRGSLPTVKRPNLFNPVDQTDRRFDKYKFNVPFESPRSYTIRVKLSNEINCTRCVFRWIYVSFI